MSFNPNDLASPNDNIFGYPYNKEQAKVVLIPVPWDSTASYRAGTSKGPKAILQASPQLDFFDFDIPSVWENEIWMQPIPKDIKELNKKTRKNTDKYLERLEDGGNIATSLELCKMLYQINEASAKVNSFVEETSKKLIDSEKLVGVIGGEHSVPLGFMKTLGEKHGDFGILHIDAHADLRNAYEGFEFSHASIMFNALKIEQVKKLTQVGIRDFCNDEFALIESDTRIHTFFDANLKSRKYNGENWNSTTDEIISKLPQKVYISFDIDGLLPSYCPNTGTPVPGGLEFDEAAFLIRKLAKSGKQIIGFDLTEVAPGEKDEWDGNVGARLVFLLANMMILSNNK